MTSKTAPWVKYPSNPVLGGALGTCFDISVLRQAGRYRMWFSWRPKQSIALVESKDGKHWGEPLICLGPNPASGWEDEVNRPVVVKRSDGYHLWYTGQKQDASYIGYAVSHDGKAWTRVSKAPVLKPRLAWEKVALMCPHVLWDAKAKLFRMWYSGGEQYEPDAIGYATSPDGTHWKRLGAPVFEGDKSLPWEAAKVTACQVVKTGAWYTLFYIGFSDPYHAKIGMARSRDGITGWKRWPGNPILFPTPGGWDADSTYKPFAVFDGKRWLLWYNGRKGDVEQIGLAFHDKTLWPAGASR